MSNGEIPPAVSTTQAGAEPGIAGAAVRDDVPGQGDDAPRASARFVWLSLIGMFGAFLAYVTPLLFGLSLRVSQLTPGQEGNLGYIVGAGALASLIASPLVGQLSDRTRSRFGRRRPWVLGGALLGTLGLLGLGLAPNILLLGASWVLVQCTWSQAFSILVMSQADRLAPTQRGKVSGFGGIATGIAPVLGVALASSFAANNVLVFLVPGTIGLLLTLGFVFFYREPPLSPDTPAARVSLAGTVARYKFSFRTERDFGVNFFVRLLFMFGIGLATTFTAFVIAANLQLPVAEIGPIVTMTSLLGVAASILGALAGGALSDRLRQRKPFLVAAAVALAAGAILTPTSTTVPGFAVAAFFLYLGIGLFGSVDQALMMDVIPDPADAGRFIGITGVAIALGQSGAPFVAPALLGIGAGEGGQNYLLLYIVGALSVLVGASLSFLIKRVR